MNSSLTFAVLAHWISFCFRSTLSASWIAFLLLPLSRQSENKYEFNYKYILAYYFIMAGRVTCSMVSSLVHNGLVKCSVNEMTSKLISLYHVDKYLIQTPADIDHDTALRQYVPTSNKCQPSDLTKWMHLIKYWATHRYAAHYEGGEVLLWCAVTEIPVVFPCKAAANTWHAIFTLT